MSPDPHNLGRDDDEPMEVDEDESLNDTQETTSSSQGGGPPHENLTDIYARHYEEAQQLLQDGATSAAAVARVGQLLKESSILCKSEKKVRESLHGGSVLSILAQVSRNQAMALDTNLSSFDPQAFADGILLAIADREVGQLDWSLLASKACNLFKRAPVLSYLYGSFKPSELPPKERKVKERRAVRAAAEKKEPEKVTQTSANEEGNDKLVQHLKKVLKRIFRHNGNQPISFFEFVLDPDNFHHTVENIFHLSFLMKNNFCAVKQEGGGLPYIYPVSPHEVSELQKGKKLQCIVSISPEMWENLVKVFEIKTAMVPPLA